MSSNSTTGVVFRVYLPYSSPISWSYADRLLAVGGGEDGIGLLIRRTRVEVENTGLNVD